MSICLDCTALPLSDHHISRGILAIVYLVDGYNTSLQFEELTA